MEKHLSVEIYGSEMHYIEEGVGNPILFLHGMPTSSYVWRNIIPFLAPLGRCIAPDLIGMGKSAKPDIEYTLADHIKYIEKFIEKLNLKNITLVVHGWGSVIGFDYAMRHESNCRGLVFYEAYLRSFNEDDASLPFREQMVNLKQQENIEDLILNTPYYVDKVLQQETLSSISPEDMAHYREPFLQAGSGKPLQQYFKEKPCGDGKSKADSFIANYSEKLTHSSLPKLMLYSFPGFITTMATVVWAKENLPHIELVDMGEELHYAQESNPALMGETISVWLQGIEA